MSRFIPKKEIFKKTLFLGGIGLEIFLILLFLYSILIDSPAVIIKIKSDSMLPFLSAGDFVVLYKLDYSKPDNLIGKVIAFYDPTRGEIIVHRVIQRDGGCYETKGDNSQFSDIFEPCPPYILGEVWLKI